MKLDTVMEQAIAGIAAGIVAGIALWLIWWAWHEFDVGSRIRRQITAAKVSEQETEDGQLAVMREQVAEVGRGLGIVLPVSVRGSRPQIVTFSDGGKSYYYGDSPTYKRIMNSASRTDLRRSFHGRFTKRPVSRWSRAELEAWLSEHASG